MKQNQQSNFLQVQSLKITQEQEGQRLDNFLLARLKGVPKSRIYRLVRKGEVRVNKGRKEIKYRLNTGDVVRIPPIRIASTEPPSYLPDALKNQLEHNILFEDESLLVLNKPFGFAVHGGTGIQSGIIEAMRLMRPNAHFLELVHRLDRDTSGCLIIAKKRSVLRVLHEQFRGDGIKKTYLAILNGNWQRKKLKVDAPLKKNVGKGGERHVVVHKQGKTALSLFTRKKVQHNLTLVSVELKTGRTHQIRVHAAWLGHPIVGDERYGDNEVNKVYRIRGFKRMFLHAQQLSFKHPVNGLIVSVTAPMPESFKTIMSL